ncbi:MAG: sugar ABC transporter permease [Actinobacteria bacterium]|nr:sugar ABC transporter permease [Actinomycetota bacterium]
MAKERRKVFTDLKNVLTVDYTRDRAILWLFLSPAFIFILFANIYPIFYTFFMSFFKFNRLIPNSVPEFYGFSNYIELIKDPIVRDSIVKTIYFVAVTVTAEFVIAILLALLITTNLRGMQYLRGFFLVPLMMTPVVAGTLWRTLYDTMHGPFNYFIQLFGFSSQDFLGSATRALPSIMVVEIWQATPVVVFILAAGIQALPVDIYKSAAVDGASKWQIFTRITLPLLKPVFFVALLLRIMDAFKVFDTIYTMTYGGPGKATELISMFIYKEGLKYFKIGRASALSVMFLIIIFLISINFLRRIQKKEL